MFVLTAAVAIHCAQYPFFERHPGQFRYTFHNLPDASVVYTETVASYRYLPTPRFLSMLCVEILAFAGWWYWRYQERRHRQLREARLARMSNRVFESPPPATRS